MSTVIASPLRARQVDALTTGPVLPTLLRLALPNTLAMVAVAMVSVAETRYVGAFGRDALAAMAVVFPFVMLMQNLSSGAMGGGVSSSISRALGAGNEGQARELARHAVAIAAIAGLLFSLVFLAAGKLVYALLGASNDVLRLALAYSNVVFCGAVIVWGTNSLISILRGTGDMRSPSAAILAIAALQVALGAAFGFGLGPFPRLGMPGVALGLVLGYGCIGAVLLWLLLSGRAGVRLQARLNAWQWPLFREILRVGLPACLSPVQTVLTVLVATGFISRLGADALAGFGIGSRLEFLLIPIAFAVGVATVPMVGMAIGKGDVARARQVAWTGAALSGAVVGAIGLIVALWPAAWSSIFSSDAGVLQQAQAYLRAAGPGYAFFGIGMTLFFASQGAGRVLGPVLAGTARLVVVATGAFVLHVLGAPGEWYFILIGASMALYGVLAAFSVYRSRWAPP
jgi:putative MATE family efflux protein